MGRWGFRCPGGSKISLIYLKDTKLKTGVWGAGVCMGAEFYSTSFTSYRNVKSVKTTMFKNGKVENEK